MSPFQGFPEEKNKLQGLAPLTYTTLPLRGNLVVQTMAARSYPLKFLKNPPYDRRPDCPEGTDETEPKKLAETDEADLQSSFQDSLILFSAYPAINRWAIVNRSYRDPSARNAIKHSVLCHHAGAAR